MNQGTRRSIIPRKNTNDSMNQGRYYALIIGISKYRYQQDLEFPLKDARKMQRLLKNQYTFDKEQITFLENPNRTQILDALDSFEPILKKEDSLLIFYAGHGHWDAKKNRGFWLPQDAKIRATAAWISNGTLQDYLLAYECQHVLVISDSCFSGALLMNRSAIKDASKDIQTLYNAKSRKAITSGVKEEVPDRSVFFKELSYFLRKNHQTFLSASELFSGIRNKIIAKSPNNQKPQFGAIADTDDEGGDFIFIKKEAKTKLSIEKNHPMNALMQDARIKARIIALEKQLDATIPSKSLSKNLLIASWNIRRLGSNDYGGRLPEALGYIATIIKRFDIVAIQEIYRNFQILDVLKSYLGDHWDYIFSDTSIGLGGSDYRLGYFYDKRTVLQGGMISDLILPSVRSRNEQGQFVFKPAVQLLRPPFNCGFKVEDKRLILCNLHLVFGSRQKKRERIGELESILNYWQKRLSHKHTWTNNVILLGNFQTDKLHAKELHLLDDSVFNLTDHLKVPSNAQKSRYYNHLAFHLQPEGFRLSGKGGAFDFFESVFRLEDKIDYEPIMGIPNLHDRNGQAHNLKSKTLFYDKFWRTAQMSDNLPLWVELLL
jgi:hypothetical protein